MSEVGGRYWFRSRGAGKTEPGEELAFPHVKLRPWEAGGDGGGPPACPRAHRFRGVCAGAVIFTDSIAVLSCHLPAVSPIYFAKGLMQL